MCTNVHACSEEMVCMHTNCTRAPTLVNLNDTDIPIRAESKCLEYWWWRSDLNLYATGENIKQAHQAFFLFGSVIAFQADLSPTFIILETCVWPILLYGSENWILTKTLVKRFELFQEELAKRILKFEVA